jgi:hypothetical protein
MEAARMEMGQETRGNGEEGISSAARVTPEAAGRAITWM